MRFFRTPYLSTYAFIGDKRMNEKTAAFVKNAAKTMSDFRKKTRNLAHDEACKRKCPEVEEMAKFCGKSCPDEECERRRKTDDDAASPKKKPSIFQREEQRDASPKAEPKKTGIAM